MNSDFSRIPVDLRCHLGDRCDIAKLRDLYQYSWTCYETVASPSPYRNACESFVNKASDRLCGAKKEQSNTNNDISFALVTVRKPNRVKPFSSHGRHFIW